MTIKSATLALAPTLYWPMDDPTGPAAADATGNGNTGFFTAGTALLATGPEIGTQCVSATASNSGVSLFGTNPLTGTGPFTLSTWFAVGALPAVDQQIVQLGTSNATGIAILLSNTGTLKIVRAALEVVDIGAIVTQGRWHHLVHTFTPSANRFVYLDGAQVDSHPAGVPNATNAADPIHSWCPAPGLIAHSAYWNSALSGANVTTLWSAGPGPGTLADVTGTDTGLVAQLNTAITDLSALQATCNAILAAVRKTY